MLRFGLPISLSLLLSCSGGLTEPPGTRSIVAQFAAAPSSEQLSTLAELGTSIEPLAILRAAKLRTTTPVPVIEQVAGVIRALDLGEDPDPWVSIFVSVSDSVSSADLAYVSGLDPLAAPASIGTDMIAAILRLSRVSDLGDRPRFLTVEIGMDDSGLGMRHPR